MKATLEFSLPEEDLEHEMALKGSAYHSVIEELWSWLRSLEKYKGVESVSVEEVRDKLHELTRGLE